MRKSQSTIKMTNKILTKIIPPIIAIAIIIAIWSYLSGSDIMPSFMMPSPIKVWKAFIKDWNTLWFHAATTLKEAGLGLIIGISLSFIVATIMDSCHPFYNALYPILVISQTIPSIAIAPLLMLWMGYGIAPKIVLIVITTFFPITVGLLDGFNSADPDILNLLKSMGAGRFKRYLYVKLPSSLTCFFSGLKISVTYSIVGAVISEWIGGQSGLGVFMTRCRKSFAYDRMFSVILFIAALSLLLMLFVTIIKWIVMPWERKRKNV